MNTKKIVSLVAAAAVMLTSSVTASAETVNNDDLQEISLSLSVEEFADLASDYGCSVTIGGNGDTAEPQMHKDVTHTFTDNDGIYDIVGKDTPLLYEEVQLQNIKFSNNIKSIYIRFLIRLSETDDEVITNQGQNSRIYKIPFGTPYTIYMKAIPKNAPFSTSNPGTVSFYWTDRSWEVN